MDRIVDVIIPACNAAQTIESSLASIQEQTVRQIRIIVINDGSSDGTGAIVARLAAEDPRITLLEQPNGGIVDALNHGFDVATAEFMARHDADDLAAPDRFAKQLAYLRAHPDCCAVGGAIRHMDGAGRPMGGIVHFPSPALADPARQPQLEPYLPHPFLMARRAAVAAVGGYRHVFHAEDTDLYWRLQEVGTLHNLPDVLGEYRVHTQSITGASLLNGRISAVSSQRAGLSAMRRRAGKQDLHFPKAALAGYKAARSLHGIIQAASPDLAEEEAGRLAVSACAKLLELASHRPYELELEDCATANRVLLPALPRMDRDSRRYCSRLLAGTAARLVSKGKLSEARLLMPWRLYPEAALRVAWRWGVPPLRAALRRARASG